MATSTQQRPETVEAGENEVLRAQLAVTPHPDSSCAVLHEGGGATDLNRQTKYSKRTGGEGHGECHTELTHETENQQERQYLKSNIRTECICPVFEKHDCIPRIKTVDGGAIIVVVTVPSREVLRDLLDDLRSIGADISVEWLMNGGKYGSTVEIDVSSITSKQREALETALDSGYYETPRETDLGDLANELGISESAASQRLNAAETKLVKAFLEE